MFGTLDTSTLNAGLNIGRRLIVTGNAQGSLAVLREVFANAITAKRPATSTKVLLQRIGKWIVPIARPRLIGHSESHYDEMLSLVVDLIGDGFLDEAVRVLVTAIELYPGKSEDLLAAAEQSLDRPIVKSAAKATGAARRLMHVGMDYMKAGAADGIVLMGAAHRIGGIPLPVGDIGASVDLLPDGKMD